MTVDSLIKQCQLGDEEAFAELLGRYYDTIYATAWRWCGDQSNAQDITQNVCMKLARTIGQYQAKANFTTWLYRLTINCAKDFYKSPTQHNQREDGSMLLDDLTSGQPSIDAKLDAQQILLNIGSLAEELVETLLLVFVRGLNHQQAAQLLGVKPSTISWRIFEARKQLRRMHGVPSEETRTPIDIARGQP